MDRLRIVLDARLSESHAGRLSQNQYERTQSYIRMGIEEGADVLAGARTSRRSRLGLLCVLHVKNDMKIDPVEIFGPVLSVIAYNSGEEPIRTDNDSKYGIHAAVKRAHRVASQLRAGRVVCNGVMGDPQTPGVD